MHLNTAARAYNSSTVSRDIGHLIIERSKVTVPLTLYSMAIAILLGVLLGAYTAVKNRQLSGALVSAGSQMGIAIPDFWLGLLLATVFAVELGWFPSGGFSGWDEGILNGLWELTLPAVSIGVIRAAVIARYTRTAVIDVKHDSFIRTARAKGLTQTQALWRHGARNAALVVVTILGIQFGISLGGAVVIETVFNLPGLGRMVVSAIGQRDLLLVRSTVMVLIAAVVVVNFATDILYGILDPRTKVRST